MFPDSKKQKKQPALFLESWRSREEGLETIRKVHPGCPLGAEAERGRDKVGQGHTRGNASRRPHKLPSPNESQAAGFLAVSSGAMGAN